jgi:hypothetical protein
MLGHFLGSIHGTTFMKHGWMKLDKSIRWINATVTEYSKKFTKNYQDALNVVA